MQREVHSGFDAALVDRDGEVVILVQVKVQPTLDRWDELLRKEHSRFSSNAEYVLVVNLEFMDLYRVAAGVTDRPIIKFETPRILRHYDPSFTDKRIFKPYLITLVEAWLRDLAYHWKSDNPPGSEELRMTGLLEKIEGGTTQTFGA